MTFDKELADHIEALRGTVASAEAAVTAIVEQLTTCFDRGGKLLLCGNGGSAADAQHLAAEFINRLRVDRAPLPAIALTTDTSVLTCIGNDSSYDRVFARQVEALGQPGDVLFAFSTSGSPNVLEALRAAQQRELITVGFTGERGTGRMSTDCNILVTVPSSDTARVQECHQFVYHVIAGIVERGITDSAANDLSSATRS